MGGASVKYDGLPERARTIMANTDTGIEAHALSNARLRAAACDLHDLLPHVMHDDPAWTVYAIVCEEMGFREFHRVAAPRGWHRAAIALGWVARWP